MSKIFKRDQGKGKLGDKLYKLVGYMLNGALGLFFGMFLIGGIVSSVTGCSSVDDTNTVRASEVDQITSNLRLISDGSTNELSSKFGIVVDTDTGVEYMVVKGYDRDGVTVTPLYNADGTLKRYSGPLD